MSTSIQKHRWLVAIILTVFIAGMHAWWVAWGEDAYTLQLSGFQALSFNYPVVVDALFELWLPILALYVYSTTAQFRELIKKQSSEKNDLTILRPLAFIQLLAVLGIAVVIYWTGENATISLFIVIVGGLLGGWRIGVILGIWRGLLWWLIELIFYADVNSTAIGAFLWDILFWHGFLSIEVMVGIWVGLLSGWIGDWWGEKRFQPVRTFFLGVILNLFVGLLSLIALGTESYIVPVLVPVSVAGGLAMAGFAFIVQNTKGVLAQQQAAAAEQARLQAEVRALQAQMNPHFLFNSLNTIRYFIRAEPAQARQLLLDLSTVFQRVLRSGDFISLADELDYVAAYLNLEKARLGDRLKVELPEIDDSLAAMKVPTLILQPLVENATIHGIGKQKQGGTIVVTVAMMPQILQLEVLDDGIGIAPERMSALLDPVVPTTSIGLRNTNGRLRAIYGENCQLQIDSELGAGTRIVMQIPISDRKEI